MKKSRTYLEILLNSYIVSRIVKRRLGKNVNKKVPGGGMTSRKVFQRFIKGFATNIIINYLKITQEMITKFNNTTTLSLCLDRIRIVDLSKCFKRSKLIHQIQNNGNNNGRSFDVQTSLDDVTATVYKSLENFLLSN